MASFTDPPSDTFQEDTSMANTPDLATEVDNVKIETSDEEDDEMDSITDESSVDEDQQIPRGLPIKELPTGLCYDERMRYHAELAALSAESVHPEDPRRIYYIYKELCEAGLVAAKGYTPIVRQPLFPIDAREATREEICLVHTQDHYDFVEQTAEMTDDALIDLTDNPMMDSIYFNTLSFYSGKLSAGGAIETCKAVLQRRVKNAIAVIRPPGHHAEVGRTMGFCLFNNTCIAARVCQDIYGYTCRKILILDWDVHHGNGCQNAFYDDPNILYISLHVHAGGKFYPSGPEGNMYHCGIGEGLGKNVNIPWETKGMGDGDYMYAFQQIVMPIANEFDPDFVIVSAGFDAAAGDELGGCNVTPPCYAHMTHMLMSLADGKVAVCLEGGYNFRAISKSALAVTRTLMGEPPDRLGPTRASVSAIKIVGEVRKVQSRFWECLYPKEPEGKLFGGERLHDVLREWQSSTYFEKFRMTELYIQRENISRTFDHQVLATPAHDARKHLLLYFHDPPDLLGPQDPLTVTQKPHDTFMFDASSSYIKRAVEMHMAVIDVNIPEYITITKDPKIDPNGMHQEREIEYASTSTDVARLEGGKLAEYIWDNYVEPFDFDGGIWIVGAGNAFHAVAKLVGENESLYHRVRGIISFICTNPVRPITNPNSHWIGQWYRENSRVFVAGDHSIWQREASGKKLSKKYGRIEKSPETVLNSMMTYYVDEVFSWIQQTGDFSSTTDEGEDDSDPDATEDESDDLRGSHLTGPQRQTQALAAAQAQAQLSQPQYSRGPSSAIGTPGLTPGPAPSISVASPSPQPGTRSAPLPHQQIPAGQFYGSQPQIQMQHYTPPSATGSGRNTPREAVSGYSSGPVFTGLGGETTNPHPTTGSPHRGVDFRSRATPMSRSQSQSKDRSPGQGQGQNQPGNTE